MRLVSFGAVAGVLIRRYQLRPASLVPGAELAAVDLTRGGHWQIGGTSPTCAVNIGWRPGDFVIRDNQATSHYAVNDHDGPRVYRRMIGG
jgi:hypothetical protein